MNEEVIQPCGKQQVQEFIFCDLERSVGNTESENLALAKQIFGNSGREPCNPKSDAETGMKWITSKKVTG